jgi:sporulation protein YlmC with PRC-barrel domain
MNSRPQLALAATLCGFLGLWTAIVSAQVPESSPRAEANPPRNKRGEPELGPVHPATSLLGQEVRTDDGYRAGRVSDVALDLDEGHVAALLIAAGDAESPSTSQIAIPWELVQIDNRGAPLQLKLSQSALERAPRLKAGQTLQQATRVWLATVYQHFKLEPYWQPRQQASAWGKTSDYGKLFNPQRMVTVEGKVTDISYLSPLPEMAIGAQLTIETSKGVVKAQLGPLAYLSEQQISFEMEMPVKVEGSEIMLAGNPVVMATTVETGGRRLRLRDADGKVYWREWSEQDASYAPLSLRKLIGTAIHNNRGEDLGKIADFAIATEHGLLAYVAMTCTCFDDAADKLFPVPLSAFVVRPESRAWRLELPLEVLEGTKPFPVRQWPEKIDRGWVEYVHVRYGRSPFGGVRTQPQAEPQTR